jgi:hypothetical protein
MPFGIAFAVSAAKTHHSRNILFVSRKLGRLSLGVFPEITQVRRFHFGSQV